MFAARRSVSLSLLLGNGSTSPGKLQPSAGKQDLGKNVKSLYDAIDRGAP